ncbi:response regulator transcription factor [Paenibacillus dokdonensis]|uniref:response regulator transcription factor n=1 Tax=Paenibacillus dokdonensis TaxID=2567944 RepID=UPI0010A9314D|nr:response regulator [Paenibacillus dokdonensis]
MIRAMIVDDEHLVRVGLRMTMPWEKFKIEVSGEARTAEEALKLLEKESYDLMFIDISMPGMNGLDLVSLVKEQYPEISTVILTCHQEFDYVQKALRFGAVDYLVKTQLELDVMEQALERIVSRVSEARTNQEESTIKPITPAPSREDLKKLWYQISWLLDDILLSQMTGMLKLQKLDECSTICKEASTYWAICLPVCGDIFKETIDKEKNEEHILGDIRKAAVSRLIRTNYTEDVIKQILLAVDYIHHCNGRQLTQAQLCVHIGMSRSYFSKCFRDIVGVSFGSYIQNVGLNHAKLLLLETNYPVYRIAEEVGFQDEKYFSKLFRERTGMLPSQYRSSQRI